jgi:hypothetical protein
VVLPEAVLQAEEAAAVVAAEAGAEALDVDPEVASARLQPTGVIA